MKNSYLAAEELIAKAECFDGIRAGIADVAEVLNGPSYKAVPRGEWKTGHSEETTPWIPNARSLLVLAMHHPGEAPRLDWSERGNSEGNRRMTKISYELKDWIFQARKINAQPLPYHVERGGVFLKDAAVFAGMGVVGKNNLFLHRCWGPRVRLRAILVQESLPSKGPLTDFKPCETCAMPCRKACPQRAFGKGGYDRPACIERLNADRANPIDGGAIDPKGDPIPVIDWCRRCEFACPVGSLP